MLKKLIIIISFCLTTVLYADSASNNLINLLASVHSMSASFQQQASAKNSHLQNARGVMAVEKPGKFRWDIRSPSRQLIVADGKRIWIFDVDLQQVTTQSLQRGVGSSPAMLLSGDTESLTQNYFVTDKKDHQGGQWFSLLAKRRNEAFAKVDLYFKQNILQQMKLENNLGQRSTVTFSNMKINPSINAALFHFAPPPGVDVLNR